MNARSPATTLGPVLAVAGLTKRYGDATVVRDVTFEIARGECFGLLGPNGAGKTTTLRLCLGLTGPDGGTIDLAGHAIPGDARRARQAVGVVPQFDNLDPDFTVEENLLVFARYFGLQPQAVQGRIPELLAFAGLEGRARAPLASLSGGMKRRLTLARALVNDPELVFLDEPTTGLDPQARHLIWERLRQLTARGKTLVLTTHFMDEAERLCNRIAVMDAGRIVTTGPPRELIAEHIEPHVVEIYGDGAGAFAARELAGRPDIASRVETVGETVFCYASSAEPLTAKLQHAPGLRYLHRPANLEDLFLKLTGRELRD